MSFKSICIFPIIWAITLMFLMGCSPGAPDITEKPELLLSSKFDPSNFTAYGIKFDDPIEDIPEFKISYTITDTNRKEISVYNNEITTLISIKNGRVNAFQISIPGGKLGINSEADIEKAFGKADSQFVDGYELDSGEKFENNFFVYYERHFTQVAFYNKGKVVVVDIPKDMKRF